VAAAYEDWSAMSGSLQQLGINLSVLCVAAIGTLLVQRAIFRHRRQEYLRGRGELPRRGRPPLLR
jgi:hypothetical protein